MAEAIKLCYSIRDGWTFHPIAIQLMGNCQGKRQAPASSPAPPLVPTVRFPNVASCPPGSSERKPPCWTGGGRGKGRCEDEWGPGACPAAGSSEPRFYSLLKRLELSATSRSTNRRRGDLVHRVRLIARAALHPARGQAPGPRPTSSLPLPLPPPVEHGISPTNLNGSAMLDGGDAWMGRASAFDILQRDREVACYRLQAGR